ncbi:MAG: BamA/TamA family outer membrane protein [Cyanobacteria bacterium P01_G01_bin.54]
MTFPRTPRRIPLLTLGGHLALTLALTLGTSEPSWGQWQPEPGGWLTPSVEPPAGDSFGDNRDKDKALTRPESLANPPDTRAQQVQRQEQEAAPAAPDINFGPYLQWVPGLGVARPHALQGTTVQPAVSPGVPKPVGARFPFRFEALNVGGDEQTLTLRVVPGSSVLGFDLTFRDPQLGDNETGLGYAVNLSALSHDASAFQQGEREITLANGKDVKEIRWGGGVQFFQPIAPNTEVAWGLSYQRIAFSDSPFGSQRFRQDAAGNALTASGNTQDDLLTLNANLQMDNRNSTVFPTGGDRLQLGVDQALPIGAANTGFTRLGLNYSHFVPVDLIRMPNQPGTLILNLQAGTMPFDEPPGYEAYTLGGGSSVRGYGVGELGNPQHFLQGTVEYRFPVTNLELDNDFLRDLFGENLTLAGNLFVDAATGFDTDDQVIGQPSAVRQKPGEGIGYGAGILATSAIGLLRLEFGIADNGATSVIFVLGDRF